MIYPNNLQLAQWLQASGHAESHQSEFELNDQEFAKHLAKVKLSRPEKEWQNAAAFRCLTHGARPKPTVVMAAPAVDLSPALRWLKIIALLIFLFLIGRITGHAQNVNPAIVVATCGTAPSNYPAAGNRAPNTVDVNGNQCAGISVTASVATAGLASAANQTNGSQLSQIVDAGGEAATVTGGKLDVNATVSANADQLVHSGLGFPSGALVVFGPTSSGGAISLNAPVVTGGRSSTGTAIPNLVSSTGATVIDSSGSALPVTGTVTVTDGAGALNVIVDSGTTTVTQGTGTNLHTVVDSGTITTVTTVTGATINNGAGASAVNVQDGGNSLTVDGSVSLTGTANIVTTSRNFGLGTVAVTGADSSGTSTTGSPVLVAGATGGTTFTMVTDGAGRQIVSGPAPSATPTVGSPVVQGVTTGGLTYNTAGDTAGRTVVTGGGSSATAVLPILISYCDDKADEIQGTVSVTGTSTSNISWLRNNNTRTTVTSFAGSRYRIHDYQILNSGATNAEITFTEDGAAGSVPLTLGYGLAPTNTTPFGGSNVTMLVPMFTATPGRAMSIGASAGSTTIRVTLHGCLVP